MYHSIKKTKKTFAILLSCVLLVGHLSGFLSIPARAGDYNEYYPEYRDVYTEADYALEDEYQYDDVPKYEEESYEEEEYDYTTENKEDDEDTNINDEDLVESDDYDVEEDEDVESELSGSTDAVIFDDTLIWQMSSDDQVQNLALGITGGAVLATPHLTGAGNPTFTAVESPTGGISIEISNRGADWNAVDLNRAPLNFELGNLYTITVTGRVPDAPTGTQFAISGPSSPWSWIGSAAPDADGNFTATANLSHEQLEHAQFNGGFRLQTNNTAIFIIDEIAVNYAGTDPDWEPPVYVPTPAPYGDVLRVAGSSVNLPVAALNIEAGNVYGIFVDLLVPSVTGVDVEIHLYADNQRLFTSNVFRSHPGYHDPTFMGPQWRRYTAELDLADLTTIDFESLRLVAVPTGAASRNMVFRLDNFTISNLDGNVVVHAFDFENDTYAPFVAPGGNLTVVPNVDTREWHNITFDADDYLMYADFIQSHNEDIMHGEWTQAPDGSYAFRLWNTDDTVFTDSQSRSMRFDLPNTIPVGAHVVVYWDVFVPADRNTGTTPPIQHIIGPGLTVNRFAGSPELQPTNAAAQTTPAIIDVNRRISMGEWHTTRTWFDVTAFTQPVTQLYFRFRTNYGHNQPHDVYIRNVRVQVTVADEAYIPTWETKANLPSMAEHFADFFTIGQILEPVQFADPALMNAFLRHYVSVTAENAMKPDAISGGQALLVRPDELNLTNARTFVGRAEDYDLHIVGHALVWHEQSSAWMHGPAGNYQTRAEAMENMRWFIEQYAGYFGDRVHAWDVTNEVITSGGGDEGAGTYAMFDHPVPDAGTWQRRVRSTVPWFRAFSNDADFEAGERGWDYIYYAYVFARRYAPNALLIYNDFNEEMPGKTMAIAGMVEYFNERWANDSVNNPAYDNPCHPDYGRLLIEVIGMQAHYNQGTNMGNVRAAIERFAATGARVHVTELDIQFTAVMAGQGGWMTPAQITQQTNMYRQLFEWYLEFANYIDRVTFWGRDDMSSWRSAGAPTLFDRHLNPKSSFHAIMDIPLPTPPTVTVPDEPDLECPPFILDTPVNLVINTNGILTWDAVTNAAEYRIYVGTEVVGVVTGTNFDLTTLNLAVGAHNIRVRALGDDDIFLDSDLSAIIVFTVEATEIDTPTVEWEDDDSDFTIGDDDSLVFIINDVTVAEFVTVYVGGIRLSDSDFDIKSGSIRIVLLPEFLNTLAPGRHNMQVYLTNDRMIPTYFTIIRTEEVVEEVTVTFIRNHDANDNTIIATRDIEVGETIALPTAPTRAGYTFVGWFTARTGGTEFTATTVVTADTNVYARWQRVGGGVTACPPGAPGCPPAPGQPGPGNNQPGPGNQPAPGQPGPSLPQTGVTTTVVPLVAGLAGIGAAIGVVVTKKKKTFE